MSQLLTQCPHCQTRFRVSESQIGAAEGLVRCGSCLGLFSASLNLIRVKPLYSADADPADDDADEDYDPLLDDSDDIPLGNMDLDAEYEDEDEDNEDYEDGDEDDDEYQDTPVIVPRSESRQPAWEPYEEYGENADPAAGQEDEHEDDSDGHDPDEYDDADDDYDDDDDDGFDGEDEDDEHEDDYPTLSEEEFDSAGLVDLEDQTREYEYSRMVALDDDHDTPPEDYSDDIDDFDDEDDLDDEDDEGELDDDLHDDGDDEDDEYSHAAEEQARPADSRSQQRARLRGYLAGLRDDEALEPLLDSDLGSLDAEPLTLDAAGRQRQRLQQIGLAVVAALLLITLLLQFVNHNLEALNQRNSFKPFQPLVCSLFDCPEPARPAAKLTALYSQELLVRSHPRQEGALEVSFIFRNDAAAAQPFPGLELSFRSANNEVLANRLFLPAEYLPPELLPLGLMPANSSVQIQLELLDPGADAVKYTMAMRQL